ncbi:BTAD domain-containing putative transcriptional regulator [Streptomyces sp. TLI_171]|uniref:ATP-binding protein n=1 Tax=Streptomyces sp. TLI_171 TaxID=1938859 RepID=UPI000C17489D|nr:BTAD domain-containing putative transcriptional regulator [Streptomyces sp. TLI_171]RKE17707.1 putative ATPase [Streptomyces sp. TLI_171]
MRIGILGPLALWDGAGRAVEVSGLRLRSLLVRLAVAEGRAVAPDRLVEDLWGDAPPAAPANALQTLVSRLRALGGRELVAAVPGGYRLGVAAERIDAVEFERLVLSARAVDAPAERVAVLRRALALWRGPALAELADAGYASAAAARLEELRLTAVESRVEAELDLGEGRYLVGELEALTAAHPLRERLSGQLMRALVAAGRRAAALEVYGSTRRELADRLGVDPSPELTAVQLAVLRDELPTPEPVGPVRRGNLPNALTSFVGREREREAVAGLLRTERLVTLTGPGGAGKTRLAVEVGHGLSEECPDGVWLVPLAAVGAPAEVPQAVLAAVGVPDALRVGEPRGGVRSAVERLVDALENRRLLLVLDNCEHLLDPVAELVALLLARAPQLRVLATGREPLGITGERLCPVPSLPLPAHDRGLGPAEALEHAAVRLFADRAAAVRPGFRLDGSTTALVVGICRELDGIPLAIELAAARTRSLTLHQIAARLGDRFRLLGGGDRSALPRHRTLRAVVDWSWELLDGAERAVLRRLSVFAGGAAPELAEQVCAFDAADPPDVVAAAEVVDVIAALIDKSLVTAAPTGTGDGWDGGGDGDGDGDGGVRYHLLETVRAYAAEKLAESGEAGRARDAHAAAFLALAERAEPELRRHDQLRWATRLGAERDNFNAALGHLVDRADPVGALRLLGALAWFWLIGDHAAEAGGWARAVRELVGGEPPSELRDAYAMCTFLAVLVPALNADGRPAPAAVRDAVAAVLADVPQPPRHPVLVLAGPACALLSGDLAAAREGLLAAAGHADPWVRAAARTALGQLALTDGELGSAGAQLRSGYREFTGLGDLWGRNAAIGGLLELALIRGEGEEAVRLGEEAFGTVSAGERLDRCALVLVQLGRARIEAGDPVRGRADLEQGVAAAERLGEHANAVTGLLALSDLARRTGDLATAREPLLRALAMLEPRAERAETPRLLALVHGRFGCLAEQGGDLAAAADWHDRALAALRDGRVTDRDAPAAVAEGLAALAAARDEPARAAELLGAAHALRGYPASRSPDVRRATATAGAALAPAAFTAAYEHGRRTAAHRPLALPSGP